MALTLALDHLLSEIKVAAMVHVRHREPPFCQSWFVTFRPSQTYEATKNRIIICNAENEHRVICIRIVEDFQGPASAQDPG